MRKTLNKTKGVEDGALKLLDDEDVVYIETT